MLVSCKSKLQQSQNVIFKNLQIIFILCVWVPGALGSQMKELELQTVVRTTCRFLETNLDPLKELSVLFNR